MVLYLFGTKGYLYFMFTDQTEGSSLWQTKGGGEGRRVYTK